MEAFIEREQDRGIKITTIRTRLVCVCAFLRYWMEEGVVSPEIFSEDPAADAGAVAQGYGARRCAKLLSVIDHTRDRAMILVLLRTGMRIGELLSTKMSDIHLKERRIEIYEGEKNRLRQSGVSQRGCHLRFGEPGFMSERSMAGVCLLWSREDE